MAKSGMPSMVALLGLLAVAGYQNRDKISEALKGLQNRTATGPDGTPAQDGLSGILGGLADLFGGGAGAQSGQPAGATPNGNGHVLTGGLDDLMESFKKSGQAETADSWVNVDVPTQGLSPSQVEQAVGAENLSELSRRTGLSREELLQRLATAIPEAVDRATPGGNLPRSDSEMRDRMFGQF